MSNPSITPATTKVIHFWVHYCIVISKNEHRPIISVTLSYHTPYNRIIGEPYIWRFALKSYS